MPFPLLIPAFFFSAWLLMVFWGMISPDVGVATVGYPKAMLATIGLWLVVFPLVRKGGNKGGKGGRNKFNIGGQIADEIKLNFQKSKSDEQKKSRSDAQTISDDDIDITSSFTGISRKITSQNFKGGNVVTKFGGVQLDLTSAALADNEAKLTVRAFIGGIEITVPVEWNVETNVSATLGGVQDERENPSSVGKGAPKLVITGSATMGGINIKN